MLAYLRLMISRSSCWLASSAGDPFGRRSRPRMIMALGLVRAVELLRLGETQAVKAATKRSVDKDGVAWSERILSTVAEEPTQSTEGETLKAVQRICQKCEQGGRPHKFPAPGETYP